jgi:hypothetical protein
MKLRESPSDALLDEIIGSDRIARKTSRVPSKVKQVGFESRRSTAFAAPGSSSKVAVSLGIVGIVVSRPGFLHCSSLRAPKADLA